MAPLTGVTAPGPTLVGAPDLVVVGTTATQLGCGIVIDVLGSLALRRRQRIVMTEQHLLVWGCRRGGYAQPAAPALAASVIRPHLRRVLEQHGHVVAAHVFYRRR